MWKQLKALWKDETGQGMTEYILIVVLIAIAAIAAFIYFRDILKSKTYDAADSLDAAE